MASDALIRQRQEVHGDLHYKDDDGKDMWSCDVGGKRAYVLIRANDDDGTSADIHFNIEAERVPDWLVELAFRFRDGLDAFNKKVG